MADPALPDLFGPAEASEPSPEPDEDSGDGFESLADEMMLAFNSRNTEALASVLRSFKRMR